MNKISSKPLLVVAVCTSLLAFQMSARPAHASDFWSRFRGDDHRDNRGRGGEHEEKKHKKHGRAPHFDTTIIAGTVFDGNHNPVNGDQDFEKVTVTCNGVTKTADIRADGSYSVSFPENQCNEGDSVTVSAVTEQGSGSNSTTVYDDEDEGHTADADVTVLNVTVPEFGLVGGVVTGVTSAVGYFLLRRRTV